MESSLPMITLDMCLKGPLRTPWTAALLANLLLDGRVSKICNVLALAGMQWRLSCKKMMGKVTSEMLQLILMTLTSWRHPIKLVSAGKST